MTTIRVLLADDHTLFRQGLRQICEILGGFEVVAEAADGAQAVDLTQQTQPDVILLDINMPHLNGIEATRQIVAANAEARVIVLTMYRRDHYIFEALKAGARGYLLKNADATTLIDGIQRIWRGELLFDPAIAAQVMREFQRLRRAEDSAPHPTQLTAAEMEILRLITDGLDNKSIAEQLNLSPQTIANRVRTIFQKLNVNSRTQAALHAVRRGWVNLDPDV